MDEREPRSPVGASAGGDSNVVAELDDLVEHLQRYRTITLQVLDLVDEADLDWRPSPDQYSLGQQLLHIAQAEDRFAHGLFEGDWGFERVRFPETLPSAAETKAFFERVRSYTLQQLRALDPDELGRPVDVPDVPIEHTLRSWLWFVLGACPSSGASRVGSATALDPRRRDERVAVCYAEERQRRR